MMFTSIHYLQLLGYPIIYTDHSIFIHTSLAGISLQTVFQFFLSQVNSIICVSQANAINFQQRYPSLSSSIHIIPNGIFREEFQQDVEFHPLAQYIHNQIDRQTTIVISVLTRLVIRKGVLLLIELIDMILTKYSSICFIIAGSGIETLRVRKTAEKWNSDRTRVLFIGEIDHQDVYPFLVISFIHLLIEIEL